MMRPDPLASLLSWGRTAEQQYAVLARAGLLSARGRADRAGVIALLEGVRLAAQSRRVFGPPPIPLPGTMPATDGLLRDQASRLGEAGYLDPAASAAFEKDGSPALYEALRAESDARPARVPYTGDDALVCDFCWAEGLPPSSAYCGYCGYRLLEDSPTGIPRVLPTVADRDRIVRVVLDEGQQYPPGTIVRLIQAGIEPPLYRMVEDELNGRFGRYQLVDAARLVPDPSSPYHGYDEPLLEADLVEVPVPKTDTLIR